jgi:hypothetical protein
VVGDTGKRARAWNVESLGTTIEAALITVMVVKKKEERRNKEENMEI